MKINIIGSGVMGSQIAALFYLLGYSVIVVTKNNFCEKKIKSYIRIIKKHIDNIQEGKLSIFTDISNIDDACTIEAVSEDIQIKKNIYKEVRNITSKAFITNTSSYGPEEIAYDVVGLHFFNPIYMKLVELYVPDNSDKMKEIIESLTKDGFEIIHVNGNRGYLGNYLLFNEIGTVLKLVDKYGYESSTIKNIYRNLYPSRDIFAILDLIGLDVAKSIFSNLNEKDPSIYVPKCIDSAVTAGILGKKNKTSILDIIDKS